MFNSDAVKDARKMAAICLAILIIITALLFFGMNYINGAPEPEWWMAFEKQAIPLLGLSVL